MTTGQKYCLIRWVIKSTDFFFPNPRAYPKFRRLGGVARIVIISSYTETLNHAVYRDWLHFYLPPYQITTSLYSPTSTNKVSGSILISDSIALPQHRLECSELSAVVVGFVSRCRRSTSFVENRWNSSIVSASVNEDGMTRSGDARNDALEAAVVVVGGLEKLAGMLKATRTINLMWNLHIIQMWVV